MESETKTPTSVQIPASLLAEAQHAATVDCISVDELVRDAVEQSLRARRRQHLYAYGEGQARKLGIKEEDVERIIHEFREEERAGKYSKQNG